MSEITTLSERYAAAVDRADGDAVAALFVADGRMVVEPPPPAAPQVIEGRAAIAQRIGMLCRYQRTAHILGEHACLIEDGGRATGTRACVAHHVGGEAGEQMDRVVELVYIDTYVRTEDGWRFQERVVRMHSETTSRLPLPDGPTTAAWPSRCETSRRRIGGG